MSESFRRRSHRGVIAVTILLIILALLAALIWHRRHQAASADAGASIVTVTTAPVTRKDVPLIVRAVGTVTPLHSVVVMPQVSGTLSAVAFHEGQRVSTGQLLAQIDDRSFAAQLQTAQGTLKRDQALLANARIDLARDQKLVTSGAVAQQQLDTQQATVDQYAGTVLADQGSVANARVQLGYTRIVSPIDGIVGLRNVDPGNLVQTSSTIATVTSIDPISVKFSVPEDRLGDIRKAQGDAPLQTLALDRSGDTPLASGTLVAIDNQMDTATGTVMLRAQFANADRTLFPNQFVNVQLQTGTLNQALVVPTRAIQHGSDGELVFVAENGEAHMRRINTGPAFGNDTVVTGDVLHAGDAIIVDGADSVDDGSAIRTGNAGTPAPEPQQPPADKHAASAPKS